MHWACIPSWRWSWESWRTWDVGWSRIWRTTPRSPASPTRDARSNRCWEDVWWGRWDVGRDTAAKLAKGWAWEKGAVAPASKGNEDCSKEIASAVWTCAKQSFGSDPESLRSKTRLHQGSSDTSVRRLWLCAAEATDSESHPSKVPEL